jgi:hypothetical protein
MSNASTLIMAIPARLLMRTVGRGAGCKSMPVGAAMGGTAGLLALGSLVGSILLTLFLPG